MSAFANAGRALAAMASVSIVTLVVMWRRAVRAEKSLREQATVILQQMPLLPISSMQTLGFCRNLTLRDSDVFICSYPKSGKLVPYLELPKTY